jgi:hypothetical protein
VKLILTAVFLLTDKFLNVLMLKTKYLQDVMSGWRHDFHLHPELGFEEHRTAAKVAELLNDFGVSVHRGIGRTGVVGILENGNLGAVSASGQTWTLYRLKKPALVHTAPGRKV